MRLLPVVVALCVAFAASPALAAVTPQPGANHHLGDDSFVMRFGRAPGAGDPEALRMRVHLEHVRDLLAARPATRPALAGRRAELLGYLGEYIAKGTTPVNTYAPWRSPVFIDARGAICAVGYLIERSAGRALPEQIATAHRMAFLEDIAAAMPVVRAWVEQSGFALEELASIQPAYEEPEVSQWKTWDLVQYPQPDGAYDGFGKGSMQKQRMEGEWKVVGEDGAVLGTGTMRRGAGTWTSFFSDGTRRATGPYADNRAHGAWKLFHPSGNLAAEGSFLEGSRHGAWTFYHDTAARTPIARGRFSSTGHAIGTWQHFDPSGALFATAFTETPTPALWGDQDWHMNGGLGFHLHLVAAPGEVRHQIHQGTVGSQHQRLDSLSLGAERIYVQHNGDEQTIYDADGRRLERVEADGAAWQARDCRWSKHRKRIARSGDLAYLHGLLYKELRDRGRVSPDELGDLAEDVVVRPARACRAPVAVSVERGRRIEVLLAAADRLGTPSPAWVQRAALGEGYARAKADEPHAWELAHEEAALSFGRVLANGMRSWIEWPHLDALFSGAFETMPGRFEKHWTSGDPQERAREEQQEKQPQQAAE